MHYFNEIRESEIHKQNFHFILIDENENVLSITLNRKEKKNALHPQMLNEIVYALQYAHSNANIWAVLIQAKGDTFCAGADLKAMSGQIEEHESTIPPTKKEILLGLLFSEVNKPIVTKVTGNVFAGGFFFLTGGHIVIAQKDLHFGLPEVKRGLFPFQVMASLMDVMPVRKVIDWCIRGYNLPTSQALKYGLISEEVEADKIEERTTELLNELKENSPTAIKLGLEAYAKITAKESQHNYLMQMFMQTISSKDGREGIKAFKEKRKANWVGA